jgi:hypothetical protein
MLLLVRLAAAAALAALALPAAAFGWGGTYTAPDGTPVNIQVSDQYPVDQALPQKWADFLGSLVHGPELATLNVSLLTLIQVHRSCGVLAVACYSPSLSTMVVSADDVPGGPTAAQVVTHEYGHHIANNRVNPPWRALTWGTKRWASYMNVCARTATGQLHPGNEGSAYQLNPGEAFAEAYRVLNEQREGVASPAWDLVDTSLRPDPTALQLLEEDVEQPWTGNTTTTISDSFGGGVRRTIGIATPYDGRVTITLTGPKGLSLTLWDGTRLVGSGRTIAYPVCGERKLTLRVLRGSATGAFTVTVSKP